MSDVGRRVVWSNDPDMLGVVTGMLPTADLGDVHLIHWDNDPEGYVEPCGPEEFVFVDGERSGASAD